ncbi:MAG: formate/nitrite transporter family protein [Methanomicrobiaceae archaeon]|nr:formate/nitrite transporter family protein [Methanomicrobiaceae archaeon]
MGFHTPAEIVVASGNVGHYKAGIPFWNLVIRGFLAGAYVAIGAALATVCSTGVVQWAGPGVSALVGGMVFPVGFIAIVLTGAELFTGDAMLAPMAAFRGRISWFRVINLWIWVYLGNLAGAVFYAYLMAYGPFTAWSAANVPGITIFGGAALGIAAQKVSYAGDAAVWSLFLKAVGSNWLVNLAIFLGISADDLVGKFFGIWFPVMAYFSSGFEHCVASMYYIPAGLLLKRITPDRAIEVIGPEKFSLLSWDAFYSHLAVVTIGNIVGGLFFVAVLYWLVFREEIS